MERGEGALGQVSSVSQVLGLVCGPPLLGALPGGENLLVSVVGSDRASPASLLLGRELLGAGAQDGLDPEQRIALAAAVAGGVLLDPAAQLVHDVGAELDDV